MGERLAFPNGLLAVFVGIALLFAASVNAQPYTPPPTPGPVTSVALGDEGSGDHDFTGGLHRAGIFLGTDDDGNIRYQYWDGSDWKDLVGGPDLVFDLRTLNLTNINVGDSGGSNAILTNIADGEFTFGDIGITNTHSGTNYHRGFLYLNDTDFTGAIFGEGIVITDNGGAVGLMGVAFAGGGIIDGGVHFSKLIKVVDTVGVSDGAYGFAGDAIGASADIDLFGVWAESQTGSATAVHIQNSIASSDVSLGDLTAIAHGGEAHGLLLRATPGGVPGAFGNITGGVTLGNVKVESGATANAYGVRASSVRLLLDGNFDVKSVNGEAYGIRTAANNSTISVATDKGNIGVSTVNGLAAGAVFTLADNTGRGIINNSIALGNITATATGATGLSYGFSAGGVATTGGSVTLGDVRAYAGTFDAPEDFTSVFTATGPQAAGVEFRGDVAGSLTIGSLDARAQNAAYGLVVTNGSNLGTSTTNRATITGTVNADASAAGGYAVGILVDSGNAFLNLGGNVTATATAGATAVGPDGQMGAYGIRTHGDTGIFLSGNVTISGTTAGISTGNDLIIDLNAKNLTVTGGVNAGRDMTISGLGTTAATTLSLGNVDTGGSHKYEGGINSSTITAGTINALPTSDDAYGFLVADGGITNSTITVSGKITATGGTGGGAAGFAVWDDASVDGTVSLLGGIDASGTWAVGAHFTGNVLDSANFGTITATAGIHEGNGIRLQGDGNTGTITVGQITATSTGVNAFGIQTQHAANFVLTGDISATGPGNDTSGIRSHAGANIILGGTAGGTINITATSTNGVGIWTNGATTVDLAERTLNSTGVKVDGGNDLTVSGGGTANLGSVALAGAGTLFIQGETTTVGVDGGTINRIGGNGKLESNANLSIGGTATEFYAGAINTGTNNLTLTGGTYSGELTAAKTTVSNGATLAAAGTGPTILTVNGDLELDGAKLSIGKLGKTGTTSVSDSIDVTGAVSYGGSSSTIFVDLTTWAVGEFEILTATSGIDKNEFIVDPASFGSRQTATLSSTATALTLTTTSANLDLIWTGDTNGNWNTTVTGNWKKDANNEQFNANDYVTFDNTATIKTITVGGTIQVAGMNITGGTYTFNGGTIYGSKPDTTGQTTTGELDITGASATFDSVVNFEKSVLIGTGATAQFDKSVTVRDGSIVVSGGGEATFNNTIAATGGMTLTGGNVNFGGITRTNTFTITGTGTNKVDFENAAETTITQTGNISGAHVHQTGAGALHLNSTSITGDFTQSAGTLSGIGTITGDAEFKGTIGVTTLTVTGTAKFENAKFNLSGTVAAINVSGAVTFAGKSTIHINGLADGTYNALSAGSIVGAGGAGYDVQDYFNGITGRGANHYSYTRGSSVKLDDTTSTILQLVLNSTNKTDLTWNGANDGVWKAEANITGNGLWTDGIVNGETFFMDGDNVTFGPGTAGKNVVVYISPDNTAPSGVKVGTMAINDNYSFSGGVIDAAGAVTVAAGKTFGINISDYVPALIAHSITFGTDSTLNIAGYTPSGSSSLAMEVIQSSTDIAALPTVTIAGESVVDFLTITPYLSSDNKTIMISAQLTWNPDDPTSGSFTIKQGETFELDAVLTGDVKLVKEGAGTLVLTNTNTYWGGTDIDGGTLIIGKTTGTTASIDGPVEVKHGATLGGHGTINGNVLVKTAGTLSPGASFGTLTITGDLLFEPGSIYLYEIDADTKVSDKVAVDAGKTVTIEAGAILDIHVAGDHALLDGHTIQLFTLGAGASIIPSAGFTLSANSAVFYDLADWDPATGTVKLIYGFAGIDFADVHAFATKNAFNVALGIEEMQDKGLTGGISTLYTELALIASRGEHEELANALAMLHGEVYATSKEAAARQQRQFERLMPNGWGYYNQITNPKEWNRWGTVTGDWQKRDKIDQFSGYDLSSVGVAVGFDRVVIPRRAILGVAVGYDYANQDFKDIRSKAQIEAFRAMVYSSWYNGMYYVDAHAGYTKNYFNTERKINIDTFKHTAKGKYDDNMGSVGVEVGRVWEMWGNMFTPSIGVNVLFMDSPNVTEKKGGDANLFIRNENYTSVRLPVGVKLSRMLPGGHVMWVPELRAAYTLELADDSARVRTSFSGVRDVSFAAESGKWGQHSGRLGVGLGAMIANHVKVRLDYDHEVYNHTNIGIFSGTLGVQW
ncbi:MAG: autotransporter domain-containing protein [Planctomycetaceae bacterium]|nr:autotransporter domain-containing protein [Planctomycetaceae bacterium]